MKKTFSDGIEEALSKSLEEAVKECIKDQANVLLADVTSQAIRALSAEVAGVFLGSIAGNLLKSVLNLQDGILKRLDTLTQIPFDTGVRVANEALAMKPTSFAATEFRENRLMFAVSKLDEAETVARKNDDTGRLNTIAIVQALCLSQIVGAQDLAKDRAAMLISKLNTEISELQSSITKLGKKAVSERKDAEAEIKKAEAWPRNNWALFNSKTPSDYRTQADIYKSAAEQAQSLAAIAGKRNWFLMSVVETLKRI